MKIIDFVVFGIVALMFIIGFALGGIKLFPSFMRGIIGIGVSIALCFVLGKVIFSISFINTFISMINSKINLSAINAAINPGQIVMYIIMFIAFFLALNLIIHLITKIFIVINRGPMKILNRLFGGILMASLTAGIILLLFTGLYYIQGQAFMAPFMKQLSGSICEKIYIFNPILKLILLK